jgi:hypothetical protein
MFTEKNCVCSENMSGDSSVGIATGCGLDGREVVVRVPVCVRFSSLNVFRNDSTPHSASYPMDTGDFLPKDIAAEA